MIKARLQSLEFVGGVTVPMDANSVVVIVGPNNSGKSASLSGIRGRLAGEKIPPCSLTAVNLVKESTLEEVNAILDGAKKPDGRYDIPGATFHESHIRSWWTSTDGIIGSFLTSQILCDLNTRNRLGDCDPAPAFDSRNPYGATHPFQRMYQDDGLEKRTSDIFRTAFKRDLIIHRGAGKSVPAHVGERPVLHAGEDRVSRSYLNRLEALDRIEGQGDGIRSFASIIGRVITESRPIQLIDEPEAFLAPPQARLVAQSILNNSGERQTILATHSSEVLRGLLADTSTRVSVVRLTRPAGGAEAHHLDASQVTELWRDPILRFSSILDGLFHEGVVLTESDADCRFYEALSSACVAEGERPDIQYVYTGGKDRMPIVIKALGALKVPVATIADFDVLNNDQPLRRIVEAHGGVWREVEADWRIVKTAVERSSAFTDGNRFRTEVMEQLQTYEADAAVPKQTLKNIRNLTRNASAWDHAKSSGLSAIPPGQPTIAAIQLLTTLKNLGIFVAPRGEMEGFCRSIGGHGPRWVAEVLERDLTLDIELESARHHVREINAFLRSRT